MKTIELNKHPNQTFEFTLDGSRYNVTLQGRNGKTYLSYQKDKKTLLLNRICLNRVPIDDLFMFEDIKGNNNPYFDGFGGRFKLRLLD